MPLVSTEFAPIRTATKPRLLICGSRDPALSFRVDSQSYITEFAELSRPIPSQIRAIVSSVDVVLFDITTSGREALETIRELVSAIGISTLRPRLLCFSSTHRNPQFVLGIQKCGARYVRISSPEMLLEAIDLLVAEIGALERNGPCFQIVHRFSQGICAPGEEISAVLFERGGDFFQLPLGLTERFVFDFVAQRRLAVDSLQIVSGLSGDQFYSQHAANSGHKQINKVRRPTIKVSTQRIRDGMSLVFDEAKVGFDPYKVLRSCLAEGTNRVLYKLCAQVHWRHSR